MLKKNHARDANNNQRFIFPRSRSEASQRSKSCSKIGDLLWNSTNLASLGPKLLLKVSNPYLWATKEGNTGKKEEEEDFSKKRGSRSNSIFWKMQRDHWKNLEKSSSFLTSALEGPKFFQSLPQILEYSGNWPLKFTQTTTKDFYLLISEIAFIKHLPSNDDDAQTLSTFFLSIANLLGPKNSSHFRGVRQKRSSSFEIRIGWFGFKAWSHGACALENVK